MKERREANTNPGGNPARCRAVESDSRDVFHSSDPNIVVVVVVELPPTPNESIHKRERSLAVEFTL